MGVIGSREGRPRSPPAERSIHGSPRCRKGRPKSPPAGGYVAQLLSAGLVLLRLLAVGGGKQALAQAHGLRSDLHQLVVLDVLQRLLQGERDGRRELNGLVGADWNAGCPAASTSRCSPPCRLPSRTRPRSCPRSSPRPGPRTAAALLQRVQRVGHRLLGGHAIMEPFLRPSISPR